MFQVGDRVKMDFEPWGEEYRREQDQEGTVTGVARGYYDVTWDSKRLGSSFVPEILLKRVDDDC